jgi:protein O-mannosyl-transferase
MGKMKSRQTGRRIVSATSPSAPAHWTSWTAMALLVAAILASYHNSFSGPFILDDKDSILENHSIRNLWSSLTPPGQGITVMGRPVLNFTLAINWAIHGPEVTGYHAGNLLIHIFSALLLFGIVRRTLLLPSLNGHFGASANWLAMSVAALWSLHPLQTESVTYIIQRAESLVGMWYLLTLYLAIRGATAAKGSPWYGIAVPACLLGMASKEVMVTAPVAVLLYDRTFLAGTFRAALRIRGKLYACMAATWGLLAYLVISSGGRGGTAGFESNLSWWAYGMTQLKAIVYYYLRLSFWPDNLTFDYGIGPAAWDWQVACCAFCIAILLSATLWAFFHRPKPGFLGATFFLVLLPTSSVVPVATQIIAEHRMYLALAVVIVSVTTGAFLLWRRLVRQMTGTPVRVAGAAPWLAVTAIACALGMTTTHRNRDYGSELSIWNDTVLKRPDNARAYNNRGLAYQNAGQYSPALADFNTAIRLKPDFAQAFNNRGIAQARLGKYEMSLADFDAAIRFKPDFSNAYSNRGLARANLGQHVQALTDYETAIRLKPDSIEAYFNRALLYSQTGRFPQALSDYGAVIRFDPKMPAIYANRAILYYQMGQYRQAWDDINKCRSLGGAPDSQIVERLAGADKRKGN